MIFYNLGEGFILSKPSERKLLVIGFHAFLFFYFFDSEDKSLPLS
jgi:hypothetical protein